MALSLRNELRVRILPKTGGGPRIFIHGEGRESLPVDGRHIIFRVIQETFRRAKVALPPLELICENRIPLARGLGSSSAAYLSGFLAANRLLGGRFSSEQILQWATEKEGHPDNVAPALLGGVRASGVFEGRVISVPWKPFRVGIVVAIPSFELSTEKARKVLPSRVPLKDAVFNLSAVSMLPNAFAEKRTLLRHLLNDRLHEPYRARLIPGFHAVKKAAMDAGALGMILSGAGPTLLSFVENGKREKVAKAMQNAFKRAGVESSVMQLKVEEKGAVVR